MVNHKSRKLHLPPFLGLGFISWTLCLLLCSVPKAYSADITLAWAPNTEPDLAGYRVYCREWSEDYDYYDPTWEGDDSETSCTIYGLGNDTTYCFVVRAFDSSGNESGNSNEACWQYSPPADVSLVSLSIIGPGSINGGSAAGYTATATFGNGSTQPATNSASWSEDSPYASISGSGILTTLAVPSDHTVTITASYTFGDVTKTAHKVVTIAHVDTAPSLVNLSITGPDSVDETDTASYTATAVFSDGSNQPATRSADWDEDSPHASIDGSGVLTTLMVPNSESVTVTATYTFGDVTKTAQMTVTIVDVFGINTPPQTPYIISPYHGEDDVSLIPVLTVDGFYDPDGDVHARSCWEISQKGDDFSEAVLAFAVDTASHLMSLPVPRSILNEATTYYWRARFCDSRNGTSEWSDICSFSTRAREDDTHPKNGIPDDQEVDRTLDLDVNGVADVDEGDIKSVNTVVGDGHIGVKGDASVVSIDWLESLDPETLGGAGEGPDEIPLGMISFRLKVNKPGDSANVTVYLSEPVPIGGEWYKYDSVSGWQPHQLTILSVFSDDRRAITLLLEDGDYGDADGVQNGIIVDPGGIGLSYSSNGSSGSGGGGSGGCFVSVMQ